jgi:hypothetical protein
VTQDWLLVETLAALRSLIFPELRCAAGMGGALAEQVAGIQACMPVAEGSAAAP